MLAILPSTLISSLLGYLASLRGNTKLGTEEHRTCLHWLQAVNASFIHLGGEPRRLNTRHRSGHSLWHQVQKGLGYSFYGVQCVSPLFVTRSLSLAWEVGQAQ